MKERIREILRDYQLEDFARSLKWKSVCLSRHLSGTDRRTREKYFRDHHVKKLHLGCGRHVLKGWLNTDSKPISKKAICLDATKPFPFEQDIFDYVYSEHMIEHISYVQGIQLLSESFRVLKPGGKIRIATPDLYFFTGLCGSDKSELQKAYIKHATDRWIDYKPPRYDGTFVVNNHFYSWGHQFLYDEETLGHSLATAGFTNISKYELNESEDKELRSLENTDRISEILYKLETFILEGVKPAQ